MMRGAGALLGLTHAVRFISRPAARHLVARGLATSCGLALERGDAALEITGSPLPHPLKLSYDWLRDSCQCPECVHPSTQQKLFRTGDFIRPIPEGATIADGALHVQWTQDHRSVFPLHFLRRYADPTGQARDRSHFEHVIARRTWDLSTLPATRFANYTDLKVDPLPAYLHLLRYGIMIVRGVPHGYTQRGPSGPAGVLEMADMVGSVRETFYGRFWDVMSVRGSTNIAYTDLNLDLHMDLL